MWVRGSGVSDEAIKEDEEMVRLDLISCFAFVAAVPPRKNTQSSAKGADQGCAAWMTAVIVATIIPRGVKDLRDHAR